MAWNQRPGPSGSGPIDGWTRQFLRRGAERQVGMLTALTERLERDLAKLPDGQLPSKEWVRVARLRLDAYRTLATLELDTARVRLLAQQANQRSPLSDEEYQAPSRSPPPPPLRAARSRVRFALAAFVVNIDARGSDLTPAPASALPPSDTGSAGTPADDSRRSSCGTLAAAVLLLLLAEGVLVQR